MGCLLVLASPPFPGLAAFGDAHGVWGDASGTVGRLLEQELLLSRHTGARVAADPPTPEASYPCLYPAPFASCIPSQMLRTELTYVVYGFEVTGWTLCSTKESFSPTGVSKFKQSTGKPGATSGRR